MSALELFQGMIVVRSMVVQSLLFTQFCNQCKLSFFLSSNLNQSIAGVVTLVPIVRDHIINHKKQPKVIFFLKQGSE